MTGKMYVKVTLNGPYEVSGTIPLNRAIIVPDGEGVSERWEKGESYDTGNGESYFLCRCGHSKNRPFCDGTHATDGFAGTEVAGRRRYEDGAKLYEGAGLDLLDNERLCVIARFCDRAGQIWCLMGYSDDPEVRKLVTAEACNCPGGRLTIVTRDGREIEPELKREISLVEDPVQDFRGPLWVKGGVEIVGSDGQGYQVRNRVALCRCGETRNMPFCDGSHYQCDHMRGLDG